MSNNTNSFFQQIKISQTDEWYTQESDVERIIPYIKSKGFKKILCPFDKEESKFVSVLIRNGFDVTYSHIDDGIDFFDIQNLKEYDAVISNPPFSKRQLILERLFNEKIPFALIMNFNGLFDAKPRWKLFKTNKFELLIPEGRMKFYGINGIGNSPNFQSIYVCSGILDKQIVFNEI